jgi:hypothetical protein
MNGLDRWNARFHMAVSPLFRVLLTIPQDPVYVLRKKTTMLGQKFCKEEAKRVQEIRSNENGEWHIVLMRIHNPCVVLLRVQQQEKYGSKLL